VKPLSERYRAKDRHIERGWQERRPNKVNRREERREECGSGKDTLYGSTNAIVFNGSM